jgi:GNAT superfamily N-acetyltransferase
MFGIYLIPILSEKLNFMKSIRTKNIAWVGSRTIHFEAMIKFLQEVLGLKMTNRSEDFADFLLPGGDVFEVFNQHSNYNPYFITGPVAEFLVDDVNGARKKMESAGVEFLCPVKSAGSYSWTHFKAPDGNVYGLASGNYGLSEEDFSETKAGYLISTDKTKLDLDLIHSFLSESYWAANRKREIIIKSVEHSMCFGVYIVKQNDPEPIPVNLNMNATTQQVGFARVITDHATFAYLADVFITENHRGKGLSKWLIDSIVNHPSLQGLRRWTLATRDAHGLYEQFGFQSFSHPERWMEKFDSSA